ncbi:MliC family protein [Pararhodobacter sp.]|uniref:MliC family protein n=1 Tax=Pararhodobacter sp. TaxID=2127056 RepID=UPI002AFEF83B|nr:MliC family protein [Pararhodobacter sp.]
MKNIALGLALLALTATTATADTSLAITIELDDAYLNTTTYQCGAKGTVQVHYATSETDSLALVPVDDDTRVFVGVISASGARYVAGQYEWWSTGEGATLKNLMTEETVLDCVTEGQ